MILKFARFDTAITITKEYISTYEIQNQHIFAEVVEALSSEKGSEADVPYFLWDEKGKELKPFKAFFFVNGLPLVTLNDKSLLTGLYLKLFRRIEDDQELSLNLQTIAHQIESQISNLQIEMFGSYEFSNFWSSDIFLKAFGFGPECGDSLIEKLKAYCGLVADGAPSKPICFVNLKSFLTKEELESLFEYIFSLGISVLLVESWHDKRIIEKERKTIVDQQFIEYTFDNKSVERPSFAAGFCS